MNTKRVTVFEGITTRTPNVEAATATQRKANFNLNVTGAT